MLKKFLIAFILLMSCVTAYTLYEKMKPKPQSNIEHIEVSPPSDQIQEPQQNPELVAIINEMNQRNAKIKNFSCDNISCYTWQAGLRLKLNGFLNYEKPKKLNIQVNSLTGRGKEFIMGSNPKEFWFWSKRLRPLALYHADYTDFHKTRLKNPFSPMMIMDSLGFNELFIGEGIAVTEEDGKIILVEKTTNSIGQEIGHMSIIDKKEKRLIGHLVTDKEGESLASSEILEYRNGLPYQILYSWYEEDQAMLIELPQGKTNVSLEDSNWKRPSYKKEINMGKEEVKIEWEINEQSGEKKPLWNVPKRFKSLNN